MAEKPGLTHEEMLAIAKALGIRPKETPAEIKARLKLADQDAAHQRRMNWAVFALISVVATASLAIVLVPWVDAVIKTAAMTLLGAIAPGAVTYLFTKSKER